MGKLVVLLLVPIIVLALHQKQVESKFKFLFFGALVTAGVANITGPLLGPLAFLPMSLYDEASTLAFISVFVFPAINGLISFFLLRVLIKQFYSVPENPYGTS